MSYVPVGIYQSCRDVFLGLSSMRIKSYHNAFDTTAPLRSPMVTTLMRRYLDSVRFIHTSSVIVEFMCTQVYESFVRADGARRFTCRIGGVLEPTGDSIIIT